MKIFNSAAKALYVLIMVLAVVGYCKCVYKLIHSDFEPSYKREVVYGIGTFTGLGMIIGWIDIEDTKTK